MKSGGGGKRGKQKPIREGLSLLTHWHTHVNAKVGGLLGLPREPPHNPSMCLPHHPTMVQDLPWSAVWLAYWTCHPVTLPWRSQLDSSPNNARKTGEGHPSPLGRQGCSLILSPCHVPLRLQWHGCLIHHHHRHVLLTKMENPTEGSFLPKSLPR